MAFMQSFMKRLEEEHGGKNCSSNGGRFRVRWEQPWSLRYDNATTAAGGAARRRWHVDLGEQQKKRATAGLGGGSEEKEDKEGYDFLLLSYDFTCRLSHVKSLRELLDSALPHSAPLMGCFGELHAAKTLALTFR